MVHKLCTLDGCERPLNRDGLCFKHKIQTIRTNVENVKREREGRDPSGGQGNSAYVRDMFERRRAQGLPDPVPETKEAARYAPAPPLENRKEYNRING